jgi:methionyl-tRNA formyltransferase
MNTSVPFTFAFFGSSRLSIIVLDELKKLGLMPTFIVTTPDKPQGRKLTMTPNVVKSWAVEHGIDDLDPQKIDAAFLTILKSKPVDVYVVASYGKLFPEELLYIPRRKTLNIHPSLLPQYRGASPLPTAMLDDTKQTGVSIMRLDKDMDHGPLVAQKETLISEWPTYEDFEEQMAREGAQLLASILPDWVAGTIEEKEQNHAAATYTKKTVKEDALIDLSADPYLNFRKIQAYHEWPQAYFLIDRGGKSLRVKVTSASFKNGKLIIEKVIPEGSKEMSYKDFVSGYQQKS